MLKPLFDKPPSCLCFEMKKVARFAMKIKRFLNYQNDRNFK
jgi:hypothetical protein